jgi:hypothetical protein
VSFSVRYFVSIVFSFFSDFVTVDIVEFKMTRKLQVNRLSQDELAYEVAIRGIAVGTVEAMRQALAMALRLERRGDSVTYPKYPFTVEEDLQAVDAKLKELQPIVSEYREPTASHAFAKLQSKLTHVLGRIEHIDPEAEVDEGVPLQRAELLAKAMSLFENLLTKSETADKLLKEAPPILTVLEPEGEQHFVAGVATSRRSSAIPNNNASSGLGQLKTVLPSKWDLKFSGEKKGLSLSSFLEKVEELRVARNVTKEILLESGIDLFSGRAYQFYLAYRHEVGSWDEFVKLLREEFLTCDYNERLLEEIQRRTQGPDESIGIYVAVMTGYFKRLTCHVSEETKLKILMRNISPFYQSQLGLVDVTSIQHLLELCRRLETRKVAVERYREPMRRAGTLEPDLAYIREESDTASITSSTPSTSSERQQKPVSEVVCYNCNATGHKAVGCAMPRKMFCFRCKKEGVTVRTCPDCKKSGSGNGPRRS